MYHDIRENFFQHASGQLNGEKVGPVGVVKQTFPKPETKRFKKMVSPFEDGECNCPAHEGRIDLVSVFGWVVQ